MKETIMTTPLTERKSATRALNMLAAGGILLVLAVAGTALAFAV